MRLTARLDRIIVDMSITDFLFFVFAGTVIAAALGVVLSKNPVHSVLFLIMTFFACSAIWLMLEAEFLAITLVLVYVGAVMVLFLFVVMMLDINVQRCAKVLSPTCPSVHYLLYSCLLSWSTWSVRWVRK